MDNLWKRGCSACIVTLASLRGLRMRKTDRRTLVAGMGSGIAAFVLPVPAAALSEAERHFIAEAARMKREAVDGGDQPFGAVVVKDGLVVGHGPSRVVLDRNPDAHAEQIALWDAQKRLGAEGYKRGGDLLDLAAVRSVPRGIGACECRAHVRRSRRRGCRKAGTVVVGST